ncbi:MAG TPA: cytochrome P450 [Acidimicrobiales bacterium]|jgi:cytochrome P450|nr:cytochrome P450 [Acidimicrobiales bacterium]
MNATPQNGAAEAVVLSSFEEAREAFRSRELRQALYDEGRALMEGVIVNLHGQAHLARRRLENRLFRRDTFAYYEREVIPAAVEEVLKPALAEGRGDLLPLARRTMMTISLAIAGIDRRSGSIAEFDRLYELMVRLNRGSNVVHATGDKAAITADGLRALEEFDAEFLAPSKARRLGLLRELERGAIEESELPRDVLTTLLRNQDELELPEDVVRREVAYFPWVGSFSTSDAFVHAIDHVFGWIADHPGARAELRTNRLLLQRFVHESIRLHPASPEARRHALAPVELRSGRRIPEGAVVVIDITAANRDPSVFGPDADDFNPYRPLGDDVSPWGLSFGHGLHACLGQELAGGLAGGPEVDPATHLYGAVTVMAQVLLEHGARPDDAERPERDPASTRPHFGRFPVVFDASLA